MRPLVLAFLIIGATKGQAADVATVRGQAVTDAEFRRAIEQLGSQGEMIRSSPQIRAQFLEHLIDTKLLAEEASRQKLDASDEFKLKMAQARQEILAKAYWDHYLSSESSDAKLRQYFERNKDVFAERKVHAVHILFGLDEEGRAREVLKEALTKGNDFLELMNKHAGKGVRKGGDLGFFGRGRMLGPFEDAAFSTPKGQVHPKLVRTDFGFHIIKVLDIEGKEGPRFENKREDIARAHERDLRSDLIEKLRAKASVKINAEALRTIKFQD